MWTVLYISQSLETAKKLSDALLKSGIEPKLRCARTEDEEQGECYEVLVPDTELRAAQDLIIENELF